MRFNPTTRHFIFAALLLTGISLTSCEEGVDLKIVDAPSITTGGAEITSPFSIRVSAEVTSDGGDIVGDRGVCWSSNPGPTTASSVARSGGGVGSFSVSLLGLEPGRTYYLRSFASNVGGVGYGNEVSFTTPAAPWTNNADTVSDASGNLYSFKTIGTLDWMAQNLRSVRFCNGDTIPQKSSAGAWSTADTSAQSAYNNDPSLAPMMGLLYNGSALLDPRNVCPCGWRVADEDDWNELINNNGGLFEAGGALKTTGTGIWKAPNTGANDAIQFTGYPAGYRAPTGEFFNFGSNAYWWSNNASRPVKIVNSYGPGMQAWTGEQKTGYSIRCVRD